MSQQTSISAIACAPGALPGGPVRTRFFDGMFLTQGDLENEQRFWRLKRQLTNRALGDGVVWGLRLVWNAPRRTFTLSQGYALDCCGNDLVVECPVEVGEAELWSRADPALRNGRVAFEPAAERSHRIAGQTRHACVVLQYTECPEEARPVHRDACAGPTSFCEPSRVRETSRLLLVQPPARRPTPPEKFLEELETWKASLDQTLRDALFPPQGSPTPTPAAGNVPMRVIVTVPGTVPAGVSLKPGLSGATVPPQPAPPLVAEQPFTGPQPAGVATFELQPDSGWGFTAGTVLDRGRVVETVTPPVAPSMYWSFDLAIPTDQTDAESDFEFRVEGLDLAEVFGGTRRGQVRLRITGKLRQSRDPSGLQLMTTRLENLAIFTELAEVAAGTDDQGCMRELVPWGWTVDPSNGRRIASALVMASLYAFLSEMVRRNKSFALQQIAQIMYVIGWRALFGADPLAKVEDDLRKKFAQLILDLYQRWCDAMMYPGPRCADEHHGVYLGCAEIDRSGRIVAFDPWEHRRYVVTGATLGYWAGQFGIASLDVIVGRFAQAICCLAKLPPLQARWEGRLPPVLGVDHETDRIHVGTASTATKFAANHGAKLRWVPNDELSRRAIEAFIRRSDGGALEALGTQLADGGSIAILVPLAKAEQPGGKVRTDVKDLLRRGALRTRERSRDAVADFAIGVLAASPATAVLPANAPESTVEVAKLYGDAGGTLLGVLEAGAAGVLVRLGGAPELAAGADDLVDRAELALDALVTVTVETLGPKLDRASFGADNAQAKLADAIAKKALPKVDKAAIALTAKSVARG